MAVKGNGNSLVDFESILRDHVGGWGPYQYRYMFIFAVITLELSYVYYSPILFLYVPKQHWCSPPPELLNLTTSLPMDLYIPLEEEDNRTDFSKCLMYDVDFQTLTEMYNKGEILTADINWPTTTCKNGWSYNLTEGFTTASTEFGFVCENAWKGHFSQSVFFIGSVIGVVLFGWISDKYGRMKALMLSNIMLLTFALAIPFTPAFGENSFFALRFLMGLSHNSFFLIIYVLTVEYVTNDKRAIVGNMTAGIWVTFGGMYQPWLIKVVGDWKTFHHLIFMQGFLVLLAPFILDESCRWLSSKGRIDEVLEIIQKIARINKKKCDASAIQAYKNYVEKLHRDESSKTSYSWIDLFKTKRLRRNYLLMVFTWMIISLNFDAHVRNISSLNASIVTTFTIGIALELPADLLVVWSLDFFGRRWSTAGSMILSSIATFLCAIFLDDTFASIGIAMFGRFFISIAQNAGAQSSIEIAPTQLRGQGAGMASTAGEIANIFSPGIIYLGSSWKPLPLLLLTISGFFAAWTSLLLPETAGVNLPDTIEEAENFGIGQSFFLLPFREQKKNSKKCKQDIDNSIQAI